MIAIAEEIPHDTCLRHKASHSPLEFPTKFLFTAIQSCTESCVLTDCRRKPQKQVSPICCLSFGAHLSELTECHWIGDPELSATNSRWKGPKGQTQKGHRKNIQKTPGNSLKKCYPDLLLPWCFDFPWSFLTEEIPWCFECLQLFFSGF